MGIQPAIVDPFPRDLKKFRKVVFWKRQDKPEKDETQNCGNHLEPLEDEDMAGTESYVPWMAPKVVVGGWWWLLAGGYWCCFPGNDMITSHSKISDVSVPPR